jgi:hypothetical protein
MPTPTAEENLQKMREIVERNRTKAAPPGPLFERPREPVKHFTETEREPGDDDDREDD